MKLKAKTLLVGTSMLAAIAAMPATAERILRADEVAVGEIDPAKGTDYADTILAINLYDTLVYPTQGGSGVQAHLATDWTIDGATYTFNLRDDVSFNSGNAVTAADVACATDVELNKLAPIKPTEAVFISCRRLKNAGPGVAELSGNAQSGL